MQLSPPRWLPPALPGAFVLGSTATAQTRLFDIEEQSLGFGQRVAVLGDTNGDGHVEFLSADPSYGTYSEGRLYIYDGASGTTRLEIDGGLVNTLGYSLAGAGDVNNDGVPDLIAGTSPTWGSSKARVFSGADGTQLHEFAAVSSYFAAAVGAAEDVDDDG